MRFSHDLTYDAAPDVVAGMLADPAFRQKVCEAAHVVRQDVSVEGSGAGMRVLIDQAQPTRGVPSYAKRFVGDELQIRQRETWADATTASLDVEIPGKPGAFKGTITLAADGHGTVETVAGDVKVKVPLVAGKLEGLVADLLRAALESENRVGRAWLAGKR